MFGALRLFLDLREPRETRSTHRIARPMPEHGNRAAHRRRMRRWSVGQPLGLVLSLLPRPFNISQRSEGWVTDVTDPRTWQGWLSLAVVMDLRSRLIVGWVAASISCRELVLNAVLMAVWRR